MRPTGADTGLAVVAASAAALAFAIDVSLELGVAGGVLQLAAVVLALRLPRLRDLLLFAALCSALVLLAWGLSPAGGEGWKVLTNRLLAVAAIWVVAGLGSAQRRGEDLFRQALASTPMGVLLVDARGCVVLANERAQHVFGYTADELQGLEIRHLMPPRFREAHRLDESRFLDAPRARLMGTGRELVGLHQDGHEVPIEVGLAPIRRLGRALTLVSVVDTSQRVQASSRLREQQERLRAHLLGEVDDLRTLLDRAGGFAVVTLDGRLKFANPEASRLLALDLRSDGTTRLPVPLLPGRAARTELPGEGSEPRVVETCAAEITWQGEAALAISVQDVSEAHRLQQRLQLLELDHEAPPRPPRAWSGACWSWTTSPRCSSSLRRGSLRQASGWSRPETAPRRCSSSRSAVPSTCSSPTS